jgi:hypothetical protein
VLGEYPLDADARVGALPLSSSTAGSTSRTDTPAFVAHLAGRVLAHDTYERRWIERCRAVAGEDRPDRRRHVARDGAGATQDYFSLQSNVRTWFDAPDADGGERAVVADDCTPAPRRCCSAGQTSPTGSPGSP